MKFTVLFLSFFCLVGILSAENFDPNEYRRFVTSVDAHSSEKGKYTKFKLNDGTEWYLSKNDSKVGTKPFTCGTEVFIHSSFCEECRGECWMEYEDKDGNERSLWCWCSIESKEKLPTIVSMQKILVKEGGWFSRAEYLHVLKLSDDSRWSVKYWWDVEGSEGGDHVLISYIDSSYSKLEVINLDNLKKHKLDERFLNNDNYNKPFVYHFISFDVEPYIPEQQNNPVKF